MAENECVGGGRGGGVSHVGLKSDPHFFFGKVWVLQWEAPKMVLQVFEGNNQRF